MLTRMLKPMALNASLEARGVRFDCTTLTSLPPLYSPSGHGTSVTVPTPTTLIKI